MGIYYSVQEGFLTVIEWGLYSDKRRFDRTAKVCGMLFRLYGGIIMKGLGIALVGLLAIAGGIAAATIITKKKLEKENDEDYYDDWDEEWDDDGADFDFDEDEDITDAAEESDDAPAAAAAKKPENDMVEEVKAPEKDEEL